MEAHHRHKKRCAARISAGTALQLGEILARARGGTLARRAVYDRKGKDTSRRKDDIGFAVVRGGDIVGEPLPEDRRQLQAGILPVPQ